MNNDELSFYVQTLQKKMNDYFTQTVVLESKIAYQNDIITKQNQRIQELDTAVSEYKSQLENLSPKPQRKRKVSEGDGGEF